MYFFEEGLGVQHFPATEFRLGPSFRSASLGHKKRGFVVGIDGQHAACLPCLQIRTGSNPRMAKRAILGKRQPRRNLPGYRQHNFRFPRQRAALCCSWVDKSSMCEDAARGGGANAKRSPPLLQHHSCHLVLLLHCNCFLTYCLLACLCSLCITPALSTHEPCRVERRWAALAQTMCDCLTARRLNAAHPSRCSRPGARARLPDMRCGGRLQYHLLLG